MALAREILVLAGPTAVGKSALAVEVAREVGGEIVSADSRQVYRGLDIGTATPTVEERRGVRHHLIGVLDPGQPVTAGWYQAQARRAIEDCWQRGRPVVVVGGSTLYVHALVAGLADLPSVPPEVQRQLAAEIGEPGGAERLYRELAAVDPAAAATLDATKSHRLLRLVGVSRSGHAKVSDLWRDRASAAVPSHVVVLDRPRPELYARINERVDAMVAAGLAAEMASVLAHWPEAEPTLRATIGYRELLSAADDGDAAEAVEAIKQNSRRYAKRQLTWYRRYPSARWVDATTATPGAVLQAVAPWPLAGPAPRAPGPLPTR